jgi:hypothetical protein
MKTCIIVICRLSGDSCVAFDLALANEPECEACAYEADEAGEGEDVVKAGEEALPGGVGSELPGRRRQRAERVLEAARGGGLDQL